MKIVTLSDGSVQFKSIARNSEYALKESWIEQEILNFSNIAQRPFNSLMLFIVHTQISIEDPWENLLVAQQHWKCNWFADLSFHFINQHHANTENVNNEDLIITDNGLHAYLWWNKETINVRVCPYLRNNPSSHCTVWCFRRLKSALVFTLNLLVYVVLREIKDQLTRHIRRILSACDIIDARQHHFLVECFV